MYPDQSRPVELEYGTDDKAVFNFFNAVYAWMAVGLAVTAAVAWYVSQNMAVMKVLYGRGVYLAVLLGTVALAYSVRSAARRVSATVATALFLLYSAVIGAMISGIFIIYPMATIGAAFVITGGVFGGMSVYGFVTKRDLTSMGSFLIMCVWGLFLATIVNIFVASDAFSWIITYAVLAVFIGLTAYDTQMLRNIALETAGDANLAARYAIIGSLELYLDFINIFLSILRILGSRR
jgi:hypothetical protein